MSNEYLELVNSAAQSQPVNPYTDLLQQAVELRKQRAAATTMLASEVDPNKFAAHRRVAGQLGVAPAVVEALPEEMSRQAKLQRVQADIAGSPTLLRQFSDADFAKLAHDDSSVLSSIASAARYVFSHPDEPRTLSGDAKAGLHDANRGFAGVFQAGYEFFAPALDPLVKARILPGNPLRGTAEGFASIGAQSNLKATQLSPPTDYVFAAGVSSGVRSLSGQVLPLPVALCIDASLIRAPSELRRPIYREQREDAQ
jgi:hypothetical protein